MKPRSAAIEKLEDPQHEAEARWYAVYTCSRHEKRVAEQFERKSIEHYLPVYETVHRWKDRKVRVQMPLFPGYVFVRIPLTERLRVLEVPSVVRLVGFHGNAAPLTDEDVHALRSAANLRAEPHPYLKVGKKVVVVRGPLAGREGILVRKKDRLRLVVSIDLIQRAMAVEVDAADVEAK